MSTESKPTPTPDDKAIAEAEAYLASVAHGKRAFMGSSAWNEFIYARQRVDDLRAARAKAAP